MKVIIPGNAGAGKNTLVKNLIAKQSAARLSLDEVAFQGGSERRPLQDGIDAVKRWISEQESGIIEGCYADNMEPVLAYGDELIFLHPGVDACIAHFRSRSWELDKFSPQEQDENRVSLFQWVRSCETRADEYSFSRHRALYQSFDSKK